MRSQAGPHADFESLSEGLLEYRDLGLAIFPVDGKRPLTRNGFKDASRDGMRWSTWAEENPGCGWAAPTGPINGFDVVDVDSRLGELAVLIRGFPGTPSVRTGRGVHLFFRHLPGARNAVQFVPGCDYRGDGGYVVLPPSTHASGASYQWLVPLSTELAEAPVWVREALTSRAASAAGGESIPEGSRNARLASIAGGMRARGFGYDAILRELLDVNRTRCRPPVPEFEVAGVARSISRYPVGLAAADSPPPPRRPLWSVGSSGKDEPDRAAFLEHIMLEVRFIAIRDNGQLLRYVDGYYRPGAEAFVAEWVERAFIEKGKTSSSTFVNEVVKGVSRRCFVDRSEFNPIGKLCLANGVLDLEALSVAPHSPDALFTFQLPVIFDAEATCPTFDRVVEEVLPGQVDREKLLRMFGYSLAPGNPYQVAFLAVGGGNNGKTTLLCLLRDLLGIDSVSSETLQSLCEGRFGTYSLWGKLANICTDIPANPIRYTGTFKMLTGGEDSVRGERKFTDAFFFVNTAKLIFSANELPPVQNDRSFAFWRRWVTIEFPVNLQGREDRDLPRKLRSELPGILNHAIAALQRLRADGGFPSEAGGLREQWRRRSEPLYWFISKRVEKDPKGSVTKDDLYEAFAEFAAEHELSQMAKPKVGELLPTYLPFVRTGHPRLGTARVWTWEGIRLRPLDPNLPLGGTDGTAGTGGRLLIARGPDGGAEPPINRETPVPSVPAVPAPSAPAEPGTWLEGPVDSPGGNPR